MAPHSMESIEALFNEYSLNTVTESHAPCPTCDIHTVEIGKNAKLKAIVKKIQAKNLFFKVPSKGGTLKDRMFLVCAHVDTEVDNKKLSTRLGIKASAPLRLAANDLFDKVLQLPPGSVNPFVMANDSTKEVTLLLDSKFQDEGVSLLFHPMRNDRTTVICCADLQKFLCKVCSGRFAFVDFSIEDTIDLEAVCGAAGDSSGADHAGAKKEPPKKKEAPKKEAPPKKKEPDVQTKFADDHLFTIKPIEETLFALAFKKYKSG